MSGIIGPGRENQLVLTVNTNLNIYNPSYSKYVAFRVSSIWSPQGLNLGDFSAIIDWGDGTSQSLDSTGSEIQINHTYSNHGIYKIVVKFSDLEKIISLDLYDYNISFSECFTNISGLGYLYNLRSFIIFDLFNNSFNSNINLFKNKKLYNVDIRSNASSTLKLILSISNSLTNIANLTTNSITSLDLSSYNNLTGLNIRLSNISSLFLINNILLNLIIINNCSNLSNLFLSTYLNSGIGYFEATNCKLSTPKINEILYKLDRDASPSICYLTGQDPIAPPSNTGPFDGLHAAASLIHDKGCDVQFDPIEGGVTITLDDINNTPIGDPYSLYDWNAYFSQTSSGGYAYTRFCQIRVTGNIVELLGGNQVNFSGDYDIFGTTFTAIQQIEDVNGDVEAINEFAFTNNTGLTNINIPAATIIRDSAFANCTSLSYVYAPQVGYIGPYAFDACVSLTNLNLSSCTGFEAHSLSELSNITCTVTIPTASASDPEILALVANNNITLVLV
jgi:hypothetical protein